MAYAPGIAVPPTSFYRNQSRLEPGGFIPHNPNKINVITAKVLIDGTGTKPLLNPVVVTEGAKIKIVGKKGEVHIPHGPNVETHDFPNGFLLPGLLDSHTHLMFGAPGRSYEDVIEGDTDEIMLLRAVKNSLIHMKSGVTTLRENGARNQITFNLREGSRRGYITTPRLLLCGRPVTVTGGHFFWCNQEADGIDGVRAAVRQLVKDGADHIKIMASGGGTKITDLRRPSYTVEELRAIVEEAHNMGKPTTAHCLATQSISNAVEAGVDMIEHAGFIDPDGAYRFYPKIAEKIAKQGTFISPTVQTGYRGLESLLQKQEAQGGKLSKEDQVRLDWVKGKSESQVEFVGKMWTDWNIPMISGTDAIGSFGDYCIGLELMSQAGMSNRDVILSSTGLAAKAMGVGDIVGTVEVGKYADLIVIDSDPLNDIKALRKMSMVMRVAERIV